MTTTTIEEKTVTPEALDAKAAEWGAAQAAALRELEGLEAHAGADLLDDPDAAENLAGRVAALRARADMAGRAAAEARSRAHSERVAALRAEADALTPAVEKARKALNEHDAKRDKLRKALEDFTGLPWTFEVPEPTGWRALRPREVLESAYKEATTMQARARERADMLAGDPGWVPPEQAEQQRLRASWEETLAGHRKSVTELAAAHREMADSAQAGTFDLDELALRPPGDAPAWFYKLRARIETLEEGLQGFLRDVEFFRGLGLDLDQGEVDALMVEFGRATGDPAQDAA